MSTNDDKIEFKQLPWTVKTATIATLIYLGIMVIAFVYGFILGFAG
jgi:hypothetical protein